MKAIKNYYFILGISRGASRTEIEAAYESRSALAAYDEFQASMMDEVTEAYECLSDPRSRMEYDGTLGAPPQLSTSSGNMHNFRSAESAFAVDAAFRKEVKKHKSRRQLIRDLIMAVVFLCMAGAGINYGVKRFAKQDPPPAIPAELFRVAASPITTPESAPQPRLTISSVRENNPVITTYSVQSGGIVTNDSSPCLAQPSWSARSTAVMRKDTVIFATKEMRDKDGSVWYYVTNSQFEGWANGRDVHIYKF